MARVLWCEFLVILCVFILNSEQAQVSTILDNSNLFNENKVDTCLDKMNTCDAKLTTLLEYHQGSVPELQDQVNSKLIAIGLLKQELLHTENTLQLVSNSAEDAKQQQIVLIKTNENLQKQVKDNDAVLTAAVQQIGNILNLTTDINNKIGSSQCDNLKAQVSSLETELNATKSEQLKKTEDMKLQSELSDQLLKRSAELVTCAGHLNEVTDKQKKCAADTIKLEESVNQLTQAVSRAEAEKNAMQNQIENNFAAQFRALHGANKLETYVQWGTEFHLYKSPDQATHSQAIQKCRELGMWLVKIVNGGMNHMIYLALPFTVGSGPHYWISGEKQHGRWMWTDPGHSSVPFGFTHWKIHEPSGDGNCASAFKNNYGPGDYGWNDRPCSDRIQYICQYPRILYQ